MDLDRTTLPALDGRPGPAELISDELEMRLVSCAVELAFAPSPRFRVRSLKVAIALAATLVVGVAGATTLTVWLRRAPAVPHEASPPQEPTAAEPRMTTPAGTQSTPDVAAVRDEPPPAVVHDVAPPARALAPPDDLLRQANDLRAARRWRDAEHAYEKVIAARPGTPEAYAATVAAAELRLEQMGDANGALRLYRAALRGSPQGPLGEQVLWGVARSKGALGDRDGERAALTDYRSRYPSGIFAPAARKRLDELQTSTP